MLRIIGLWCVMTMTLFASNKMMLNLSDLDIETELTLDMATLFDRYGEDQYFLGVGLLSMEDGRLPTMFFGKLFIQSKMQQLDHVTLALGMKPLYISSVDRTFASVPFGAMVTYEVQVEQGQVPLFITAAGFYGPKRLTFYDGLGYFEYRAGVMAALEEILGFVEYRSIYTNYLTGQENINRTLFAGIKILF